MIKHIGLMKFRPDAPPEEVASVLAAIADLGRTVEGLLDISVGPGVGLPVMARGYTHGFVMSFRDMLSLRGYLDHPAHLAVVHRLPGLLDPAPDSALVFNVGAD